MHTYSRSDTAIRHGVGLFAEAMLVIAIIASMALAAAITLGEAPIGARSALAATKSSSWIALASTAGAAAAQPSLGSSVTFNAGYPTTVKNPRIEVLCYQSGTLVYGEAGGVADTFTLGGGGSLWLTNGGSADCTANLYYFGQHAGKQTYNWLASTSFAAGA